METAQVGDVPGGPVVKNPPSNAGETGMIPGQRAKIPHAPGQLSSSATTKEARVPQRKSPHDETKTSRMLQLRPKTAK